MLPQGRAIPGLSQSFPQPIPESWQSNGYLPWISQGASSLTTHWCSTVASGCLCVDSVLTQCPDLYSMPIFYAHTWWQLHKVNGWNFTFSMLKDYNITIREKCHEGVKKSQQSTPVPILTVKCIKLLNRQYFSVFWFHLWSVTVQYRTFHHAYSPFTSCGFPLLGLWPTHCAIDGYIYNTCWFKKMASNGYFYNTYYFSFPKAFPLIALCLSPEEHHCNSLIFQTMLASEFYHAELILFCLSCLENEWHNSQLN